MKGNDDPHFPLMPFHFVSLQPIKLKHLSQIKVISFMWTQWLNVWKGT